MRKQSSYGVKWQLHGALTQEAQELMRHRSIQMEAERQRLWESVGADPQYIKRYTPQTSPR